MNIAWNIMMCGCKDTFKVPGSWDKGLGGLGLGGPGGTGPCGRRNFFMATERYIHCPLQPTQNGAVTSDTNPDRYKRPPRRTQPSTKIGQS